MRWVTWMKLSRNIENLFNEALAEYRKSIQFNSLDVEAHNNLGIVYYHKSFYGKAIGEFKEALKIDPNFNLARENLKLIEESLSLPT